MHFEHLHRIAHRILLHKVLRLRTSERDIALAEQSRDIPARDSRERVFPVLQLTEALGC